MSYRVLIKTTKKTEYACLDCTFLNFDEFTRRRECKAPNVAFNRCFEPKYFTCREVGSINNINKRELEDLRKNSKHHSAFKNKFALKGEDAKKYEQISLLKDVS